VPIYGPRGRVIMVRGQVWVEIHTQQLWVVRRMTKNKKRAGSMYPHDVELVAYRGSEERTLAETTVRMCMRVWEDYLVFNKETMEKLDRLSHSDPTSPWQGRHDATRQARNFFSFDAKGNRID